MANTKQEKAKQMRYRKPIARHLNLEGIESDLWEIEEACDDVRWYFETDEENLVDALLGDDDDAEEFQMMFSDLCADCERMQNDLNEEWVPECFDKFFVAMDGDDLLGFDSFEDDYFGLDGWERNLAEEETEKALERMTKRELIEAARQCFTVFQSYIGLKYRYDCLKASLDILRGENNARMKIVERINAVYDKAEQESDHFRFRHGEAVRELDRLIADMPSEVWLY